MNIEEYHKMRALESTYWWFQARRKMILAMLRDVIARHWPEPRRLRIVDLGCGTGLLMEDLQSLGWVCGLDFSPVALSYCRQRGLTELVRANVEKLPLSDGCADLVTALDLVEHVPDDHALVHEMFRILSAGGVALITVPAHPKLWSMHDVALHHQRRYEKKQFQRLVVEAGFTLQKYSYMMMSIYPAAASFRWAKRALMRESTASPHTDEFPLPPWFNAMLRTAVGAEAVLLRRWNLPFGLSLLAVAQKPATTSR
ncbi:MAG: class I SAM-dependent methyltransferase [Candidatus Sumerlaeaceae bacterium]